MINRKIETKEVIEFTIIGLEKKSLNKYFLEHWANRTKFKNKLKEAVRDQTGNLKLGGGYQTYFDFYYEGRKMDTINCVPSAKVIEDEIFEQDKENRQMTLNVYKIPKEEQNERGNYVNVKFEKIVVNEDN